MAQKRCYYTYTYENKTYLSDVDFSQANIFPDSVKTEKYNCNQIDVHTAYKVRQDVWFVSPRAVIYNLQQCDQSVYRKKHFFSQQAKALKVKKQQDDGKAITNL